MTGRTATCIGVVLTVVTLINLVVFAVAGDTSGVASGISGVLAVMSYGVVGTLVVGRQPKNALAWILCVTPFIISLSAVSATYFENAGKGWPGTTPLGLVGDAGWIVGIGLPACFLGLLIPDGHLPSRRWRPVAWVAGTALAAATLGTVFGESQIDERIPNPVYIAGAGYVFNVAAFALLGLLAAGVTAVVVRYRHGTIVERQQLKWIIAAFVLMVVIGVGSDVVPEVVWFSSWALLPIAFAISIFRYRLYEIDVIIRRTLVYAGVAVTLGALYLGAVVLLSTGFRSVVGWSDSVAVTLSTLAVALAFHPVRRRVQRLVDHRFYRSSYDATRTLEEFSSRLRQQIDIDALSDELVGVVGSTLQPGQVSLWLRAGDR